MEIFLQMVSTALLMTCHGSRMPETALEKAAVIALAFVIFFIIVLGKDLYQVWSKNHE